MEYLSICFFLSLSLHLWSPDLTRRGGGENKARQAMPSPFIFPFQNCCRLSASEGSIISLFTTLSPNKALAISLSLSYMPPLQHPSSLLSHTSFPPSLKSQQHRASSATLSPSPSVAAAAVSAAPPLKKGRGTPAMPTPGAMMTSSTSSIPAPNACTSNDLRVY